MNILSILLLAVAISIDGLGAGLAYGMRKVRLPTSSVLIVAVTSGLTLWVAMTCGSWVAGVLSPQAAEKLGAAILIAMGVWVVYQSRQQGRQERAGSSVLSRETLDKTLFHFRLQSYVLVVKVLQEPLAADLDRSGTVSPGEAGLLGLALALDAFGAGLGASLAGFPRLTTPLFVGLGKLLFLSGGLWLGRQWRLARTDDSLLSFLPGLILISLGLVWML